MIQSLNDTLKEHHINNIKLNINIKLKLSNIKLKCILFVYRYKINNHGLTNTIYKYNQWEKIC